MTRGVEVDLVVVGLGYVGLPLALAAVEAGLVVRGLDRSPEVVSGVNAGRSHVDDIDDARLRAAVTRGFAAVLDESVVSSAGTVVICVPTPLSHGRPDLSAVRSAASAISRHLSTGTLVVLESTSYPGTTDDVVRPLLESSGLRAGEDFHLAYSPERIDPGNARFRLENTPKVVGGHTPACTEVAQTFYGKLVEEVVTARGTREAELAKLIENTYRHVNIALVNEMAVFSHELGIDLWDAIRCASTKPFGYQAFFPGPGVGGHCIPIDPSYLSHKVRELGIQFRFVELAQEINARMPSYVVTRVQDLLNEVGLPLRGSKVLLLGVTYKPDIADERESPALEVAARLLRRGAEIAYHDPYVTRWTVEGRVHRTVRNLDAAVAAADVTVLLTSHSAYHRIEPSGALVLDTRGMLQEGTGVVRL